MNDTEVEIVNTSNTNTSNMNENPQDLLKNQSLYEISDNVKSIFENITKKVNSSSPTNEQPQTNTDNNEFAPIAPLTNLPPVLPSMYDLETDSIAEIQLTYKNTNKNNTLSSTPDLLPNLDSKTEQNSAVSLLPDRDNIIQTTENSADKTEKLDKTEIAEKQSKTGPKEQSGGEVDPNVFEIEAIRSHRRIDDKIEYFVKWKYFPESENTWEPETNFNSSDIIEQYWNNLKKDIKQHKKHTDNKESAKQKQKASLKPTEKEESTEEIKVLKMGRKRKLLSILGITIRNGQRCFVVKSLHEGYLIISNDIMKKKYLKELLEYYENHIEFASEVDVQKIAKNEK